MLRYPYISPLVWNIYAFLLHFFAPCKFWVTCTDAWEKSFVLIPAKLNWIASVMLVTRNISDVLYVTLIELQQFANNVTNKILRTSSCCSLFLDLGRIWGCRCDCHWIGLSMLPSNFWPHMTRHSLSLLSFMQGVWGENWSRTVAIQSKHFVSKDGDAYVIIDGLLACLMNLPFFTVHWLSM